MIRVTRRRFLQLSALAAVAAPVLGDEPPQNVPFFQPVTPARPVQVMAHRGLAMLAPENTWLVLDACASDYIEWGEIDVRLTSDGKHVVCHDERVDRTTDGKGLVSGLTLEELQKLDAGSWFAPRFKALHLLSLAEVLNLAKGRLNLYLDCKKIDPALLVKEIRAAGMEKQVVVYDSPAVLAEIRKASEGTVPTMTKYRPAIDFETLVKEVAPAAVEIDADDVTAELVRKFHARGIKVQAKVLGAKWDNAMTWARMIEAGVDWLQTDDPAGVLMSAARKRRPKWPVRVSYHRGANRYAPENTLPAIRTGVALGADFVEIDIRTTKDGQFVIMHDSTVNRTTDGKGKVNDLTLEQVRQLDAGRWFGLPFAKTPVPTLEEVLKALGEKTSIYLDAKDIAPEALLAAIRDHDLFERHVVYQSAEYLARLKKLDARVRALPPLRNPADLAGLADLKPYAVDANWRILSKDLIAACHGKGIQVFSDALGWNESVDQYRKAMDWGIDLIQTDYPLRVLRAVELQPNP
jgi:glycerophosphoryl diester phosphodiesterase